MTYLRYYDYTADEILTDRDTILDRIVVSVAGLLTYTERLGDSPARDCISGFLRRVDEGGSPRDRAVMRRSVHILWRADVQFGLPEKRL